VLLFATTVKKNLLNSSKEVLSTLSPLLMRRSFPEEITWRTITQYDPNMGNNKLSVCNESRETKTINIR
jgi:hypothetical protein